MGPRESTHGINYMGIRIKLREFKFVMVKPSFSFLSQCGTSKGNGSVMFGILVMCHKVLEWWMTRQEWDMWLLAR